MLTEFIIAFFLLGIVAGLTVGLAGIGSTLLILPTLVLLFPHYMPADLSIKMAVATTLACTSISVSYAAVIHIKKGNVDFSLCLQMAGIYALTALIGAYTVHFLPAKTIEIMLGIVLILVGAKTVLMKQPYAATEKNLKRSSFIIATSFAGLSNSICGIGTGNIAIPYLSRYFSVKKSTGTSIVSTVVACVFGTIAYIYYGWDLSGLPKYSLGYVYTPLFIVISIGMVIGTPIGYKLSERLDPKWIKRLLAMLVSAAGVFALVKGILLTAP